MEQIAAEGLDALLDLIRILINEAMRLERAAYIQADHYDEIEEVSAPGMIEGGDIMIWVQYLPKIGV